MTWEQERIERYAELVVRVGANVQPEQLVVIAGDVAHVDLVRAVAEQAYLAGASRVEVSYHDPHVRRSALRHASVVGLTAASDWQLARCEEWTTAGIAYVQLTGNPDPRLFEDIDPSRVVLDNQELNLRYRRMMLGGRIQWTTVAAPNPGWATTVFGEPDTERLWEAVSVAMRLDSADVVAEWERHRDVLAARAAVLNGLQLDAVRYHGAGTDLTVGLIADCLWSGGQLTTLDGVSYMPNLPTEEVFTSPDRRRADGVIKATRPLVMSSDGVLVEDLEVTFAGGRIVGAKASRGAPAVLAELDSDEGARSLGEVSLVEGSSRVRAAGVTFRDTLYDENTGCHVAWGQGFPFCVHDGLSRTSQSLHDEGLNYSAAHTDAVIGGPGVDVDGMTTDGTVIPLIRDEAWALSSA